MSPEATAPVLEQLTMFPAAWLPWEHATCYHCHGGFTEASWDERCTEPYTGEDVHRYCCLTCKREAAQEKRRS